MASKWILCVYLGIIGSLTTVGLEAQEVTERPNQAGWPQILGPNRDGQASVDGQSGWPSSQWADKPKTLWSIDLGSGFGGSAIVGDQVLTMHRVANEEILECTDLNNGQQIWQCKWPATYRGSINPDEGPRCVPVVDANRVYCYGAAGDLACVNLADGGLLWRRALRKEYDADDGYFGAGSTPLVVDALVIVCVGGSQAGIVALDKTSGKSVWQATDYDASYASPIAVQTKAGLRVLAVMRLNTVLLDATNGKLLGEVKFGSRGPTVNAATPIGLPDEQFFLTSSYGVGALTLRVDADGLRQTARSQAMASQYNTPVLVGERIIGIDGREDVGRASLKALDLTTQRVVWEQPDFGTAHLLALGSRVLALGLDGKLSLIDGEAEAFTQLASYDLPAGEYRALPAISGKRLVVRGSVSGKRGRLQCIEVP
jgi:outer membrane protein assembly factor BamB